MRSLARPLFALLLLAGCDSAVETGPDVPDEPPIPPGDALLANLLSEPPDPAQAEAQARAALATLVPDSASADLRNVRAGHGGAVCGEIVRAEGLRGFVVAPEGQATISRSDEPNFADWEDPYTDAYVRWCATEEELMAAQSQLAATPLPPAPPLPEAAPESLPEPFAAAPDAGSPPGQAPRRPLRPGETRRFSDAVLRPEGE